MVRDLIAPQPRAFAGAQVSRHSKSTLRRLLCNVRQWPPPQLSRPPGFKDCASRFFNRIPVLAYQRRCLFVVILPPWVQWLGSSSREDHLQIGWRVRRRGGFMQCRHYCRAGEDLASEIEAGVAEPCRYPAQKLYILLECTWGSAEPTTDAS